MSLMNFEKKYKQYLENIKEWSFLRVYFRPYLNNLNLNKNRKNPFLLLKALFFKIYNFFGRYDFLFFSDSNERKNIKGVYVDKYFDDIIEKLNGKSLLFELPVNKHFKNTKTEYIVSEVWVYLLAKIFFYFFKSYNINDLDEILKKENLDIDYKGFIKDFKAKYFIYKLILKIYKPKAIFVNCYYCRIALIKAAKDLNIPIIEIQHGIIKNHDMYFSILNNLIVPDELLSWGKVDNIIIKRVIPIGSWYIEYIKNHFEIDGFIQQQRKKYRYIICVSLQDLNENIQNKFFNFIESLSNKVFFVLIPRKNNINYSFKKDNVKIMKKDCYNILMNSDFHMSLYSSCAVESIALNRPNILVNINNYAKKYLSYLPYTKIVESKNDFDKALKELSLLEDIDKKYNMIVDGYDETLKSYLKQKKWLKKY